jgi:hypothetical protein
MARELPPFRPILIADLRRIWSEHPDPDIRRLTLEVEHYRRMMAEIDRLYMTVHQAWRENVGGNLVALHMLQTVLFKERQRLAR